MERTALCISLLLFAALSLAAASDEGQEAASIESTSADVSRVDSKESTLRDSAASAAADDSYEDDGAGSVEGGGGTYSAPTGDDDPFSALINDGTHFTRTFNVDAVVHLYDTMVPEALKKAAVLNASLTLCYVPDAKAALFDLMPFVRSAQRVCMDALPAHEEECGSIDEPAEAHIFLTHVMCSSLQRSTVCGRSRLTSHALVPQAEASMRTATLLQRYAFLKPASGLCGHEHMPVRACTPTELLRSCVVDLRESLANCARMHTVLSMDPHLARLIAAAASVSTPFQMPGAEEASLRLLQMILVQRAAIASYNTSDQCALPIAL